MDEFERLLGECRGAVERFVRYRLSSEFDADDVLQEVYIAANGNFDALTDKSSFKAWIIGIARHKCNDYYRRRAKMMEIPLEEVGESSLGYGRMGITETHAVRETLNRLADKDKEILYLYFFRDMPQSEIAARLNIPVGTVKSRLYTAKANFRESYPYPPKIKSTLTAKGDSIMGKLPEYLPQYTIERRDKKPPEIKFEELSNWFIIPKPGEKVTWADYEAPSRKKSEEVVSTVESKVVLHGVEGVEIKTVFEEENGARKEHFYMAQLTDTHCRWLGERYYNKEGVLHYLTFLDGDEFFEEWGFGENNFGVETNLRAKGQIEYVSGGFKVNDETHCFDAVGCYTINMGGKVYQTTLAVEYFPYGAITEQYIDPNGRTVLWRRFNRDDWRWDSNNGKTWSEILPDNERMTVNGNTYVHWYDCITDYICES